MGHMSAVYLCGGHKKKVSPSPIRLEHLGVTQ